MKLVNCFITLSSSCVTRICKPTLCSANLLRPSRIARRLGPTNLSCQGGMLYPHGLMRKVLDQ